MTKGKKTQKKGKSKKSAAPRKPRNVGMPSAKMVSRVPRKTPNRMPHVHAICSVTDPFCVHARNAQRPDGGPPTIPYQFRAVLSVLANATTGACRYTFIPNPLFQYTVASLVTTTWNVGAAWLDIGGATFMTNAKEIRIVSFGVIVRSSLTATTAKGLLITSSDPAPAVSSTATAGSMQASESQVHTIAAGMELAWVSKPMGPNAHILRPIATYTSTMSDFDWTSLVVEVSGSDTTGNVPLLSAEVVMNVEFTVASGVTGTALAQLQKTPPLPNRVALAAADHSIASRPSFVQGGIDAASAAISRAAKSSLDTILEDGMALLFG